MSGTQDSTNDKNSKAPNPTKSDQDASATPNEPSKVIKDPTAKFIESKPELARYSMSQVFREFLMKNHKRFNGLKGKEDYENAFKEFWGVSK